MQINPRCTKINFKNAQQTAFLLLTSITFSMVFSSCSSDDMEMPVKNQISNESLMKKNDSIPNNDSIPFFKEGDTDPPKGTIPPPPPRR